MTHDEITEKLLAIAKRRFGARADALTAGDDLYASLQIDSMQAMDLLTVVESTFDVEIPDYELASVRTLGSIATLIERRL